MSTGDEFVQVLSSLIVSSTTSTECLQSGIAPLRAKLLAQGGLLSGTCQSVIWQIALGLLPFRKDGRIVTLDLLALEWVATCRERRCAYEHVKSQHVIDPSQFGVEETIDDPLSTNKDSKWAKFHANQDFIDTIKQDLIRLFPVGCEPADLFQQQFYQQIFQDVLFVWCKQHPGISYRQGMHELLAPIVYVLHNDARQVERCQSPVGNTLKQVIDVRYIEHDAYEIFSIVMKTMAPLFDPNINQKQPSNETMALLGKHGPHAMSELDKLSPILKLGVVMQQNILWNVNPSVCRKLNRLSVEPQLYCLKWFRMLFGREFPMSQMLRIWDCIFVFGCTDDSRVGPFPVNILALIGTAMIDGMSQALLDADYNQLLTLLLKYHDSKDDGLAASNTVSQVIARALVLDRQYSSKNTDTSYEKKIPQSFVPSLPTPESTIREVHQFDKGHESPLGQSTNLNSISPQAHSRQGLRKSGSSTRFGSYLQSIGSAIEEVGSGIMQKAPPLLDAAADIVRGIPKPVNLQTNTSPVRLSTHVQLQLGRNIDAVLQRAETGTPISSEDLAQLRHARDVLLGRRTSNS